MHTDATPPPGTTDAQDFTPEELALATRNHGMPLEALRYDVTPVGLHYLLTHFDIPAAGETTWSLEVDGAVDRPAAYSLDDLRARPAVTRVVTMECAGNGRAQLSPRRLSQPWMLEAVGTGRWTGTPLWPLLQDAGLPDDVVDLVFTGQDRGVESGRHQHYRRSLTPDQARNEGALLVYDLNGGPLPPQHGFPLRLLVPGWYGMASVKWLGRITAVTQPFAGHYQAVAYRYRTEPDEQGQPVTRMRVRSLMVPPGVPDFFTRQRIVAAGPVTITGRAWSGHGDIERVEVSVDGGRHWADAELVDQLETGAWRGWRTTWHATPGAYELVCRATDAAGNTQPLDHHWDYGGYGVTTVHRVSVVVSGQPADEERL